MHECIFVHNAHMPVALSNQGRYFRKRANPTGFWPDISGNETYHLPKVHLHYRLLSFLRNWPSQRGRSLALTATNSNKVNNLNVKPKCSKTYSSFAWFKNIVRIRLSVGACLHSLFQIPAVEFGPFELWCDNFVARMYCTVCFCDN